MSKSRTKMVHNVLMYTVDKLIKFGFRYKKDANRKGDFSHM